MDPYGIPSPPIPHAPNAPPANPPPYPGIRGKKTGTILFVHALAIYVFAKSMKCFETNCLGGEEWGKERMSESEGDRGGNEAPVGVFQPAINS